MMYKKCFSLFIIIFSLFGTAGTSWAAVASDANVSKGQAASTTIVSPAFSTTSPNELLLAFVASDGSSSGTNIVVNSVTGAGLTWVLVRRTNTQRGTAEIWRTFAPTQLINATATATLSQSMSAAITVMSFSGVDTSGTSGSGAIGANVSANAGTNSGAPTASLVTTRANSLVVGVGNDWDKAIGRTPGANQSPLVSQYLAAVGDTYWVQRQQSTTPLSMTTVMINDTAPTADRYNLTIAEILVAQSTAPDLTLTKTHTGNFVQGQTAATYTITATNSGGASTSGTVTLTDTLPASLTPTVMSGTGWSCVVSTLTCTRADALGASSSYPAVTLTVNVSAIAPASVTNTATIAGGGETNTANDSASDLTAINTPPDLTITKTHSGNFVQGQTGATYTVTVKNSGGSATSATVTVTDTLPTGLTATGMAGTGWSCTPATLTCTRADALAASASYAAITLTVNVAADAQTPVTNTVTVSGGGETNTSNDAANDPTTIDPVSPPDLTITKSHTGNFIQGQTGATYTVTVKNSGGAATSGTVTVTDTLPTGLTATGMAGTGWSCTVPTLTCTRADALAASASYAAITLTVSVASDAPASVTNTVTVSGGGEANSSNDTANDPTTINPVSPPDLTISKSHSGNFVQGQTGATYAITVTNSGGSSASGTVTVSDSLPAGLTATAFAGTGWSCTVAPLTCTRSDALAAAASYPSITLTVNVDSGAANPLTNAVKVSGGGETNTTNDTANDPTTITGPTTTITHVGGFGVHPTVTNNTFTANYTPVSINDAVVVFTACVDSSITSMTLTAPGWTFTPISGLITKPAGSYPDAMRIWGAIVPSTSLVTFTVTVTGGSCSTDASILIDEFTGNDTAGGTTTFEAHNESTDAMTSSICTGAPVTPLNNGDAIWYACFDNVTGVAGGYTKGQEDGIGDWTEYEVLSGGAGVAQNAAFIVNPNFSTFEMGGVAIKTAALSGPLITSINGTTFVVGTVGSFTVTATGSPTPTFSEVGALPTGVTFSAAGILSGTPGAGTNGTYPITITAQNGVLPNATQNFTLTVRQAPAITSSNSTTFVVGSAGSFTVTATGSPAPTLSETGPLPNGVGFDTVTGILSGTPTVSGSFPITFTAQNGVPPNATQNFTLTVNGPPTAPAITSTNNTTFTVGTAESFTVTATGSPAPTFSETGTLPSGVTLTTAGVLSGTPAAGTNGTYPITITAQNGVTPNATQNFTLTVNPAAVSSLSIDVTQFKDNGTASNTIVSPAFSTSTGNELLLAFMGSDFQPTQSSTNVSVTGVTGGGLTWVLVRRANAQSGMAEIWRAFAPTALSNVTVTATLSQMVQSSMTVMSFTGVDTSGTNGSGAIGATNAGSAATGAPTASLVTTTNNSWVVGAGNDYDRAVARTVGTGQTLVHQYLSPINDTYWAQRRAAVTPASGTTVTINDTAPTTDRYNLAIAEILPGNAAPAAPAITSTNSTTFTVGSPGSFTVTATGSPAPTFSETGALPAGVTLTTAGVLSGTPAAGTSGTYPLTITAQNGVSPNATQSFTLTVRQAPAITSSNSTTFTMGSPGSFTVTATGFPAPTLSETGALPGGVGFDTVTGILSGTPTVSGNFLITFTAQNGVSPNATQNFTLTVNGPPTAPTITSTNSTTFTVGTPGSFTVTATGSPAPTFSETGALPTGVTLATAGVLSGTPAAGTNGTYPITITAQNGVSPDATQNFTLTVNVSQTAPVITSLNGTTFVVGTAGSFTVTATGSPAPTFSKTGALPTGVTFSTTGVLSGTPAAGTNGTYPITITAQNGVTPNASQNFTLTVNASATTTITLIQSNVNGFENGTANLSVAFNSNNTAGNFLIITATAARPATTLTISDTQNNAYVSAFGPVVDTGQDVTVYVWYVTNCKGGANTVKITPSVTAALELHISEWTGIATTSPVDQVVSATGTGASVSSGARTTTANGELIYGKSWVLNTASPGSGFTSISLVNGDLDEYLVQPTAGSIAATFTQSSGTWFSAMVTFKSSATQVTMTSPAPSTTIALRTTVAANATSKSGASISRVQFLLDGANLGSAVTSAPYSMIWDTSTTTSGTHNLSAIASDSNGLSTTSVPVVFSVDNTNNPAVVGSWSQVYSLPAVAVNLILLKNGKLLFYQDGSTPTVWDYTNNSFISSPAAWDLFCSGHALLADGRVLAVGGYGHSQIGAPQAAIFDPATNAWTNEPNMNYARWYPTATSLSDGRIMVTGGWQTSDHTNAGIPEIYNPTTNAWTKLTNANNPFETYPFMYLQPNGKVLHVGGSEYATLTESLDLSTQQWTTIDSRIVDGGSSSMYLPGKIMKAGSAADSQFSGPSSNTTFVLDMSQASPAWRQTPSMVYPRSFMNLTELPDGSVLATGGETDKNGGNIANAVYAAELWSPQTQTWRTMSSMQTPREYHGTALLLPDGRVVVSGMGADFGNVPDQRSAEFFSPPYLSNGARPTISQTPSQITYNQTFFVGTPNATSIASAVLIRTGAVTHFFDQNTRYVPVTFQQATGGLTLTAPIDANSAPPGFYMLFLVNTIGVPSVAPLLQLQ